jgi:4,5-DOPA dioxygenase extradiol
MSTDLIPRPAYAPVFVSHGSPMTALEPGPAGAAWQRLGAALQARAERGEPLPRAIVAFSAHTLARMPVVLGAARHEAVHDFGGFPDALYQLRYDAPGAPDVAEQVTQALRGAGFDAELSPQGGLDHGIWTPLRSIRPQGDIPVVPVAFPPSMSPQRLFEMGEALRPLVETGVWVIGTGSITHNLRLGFGGNDRDAPEMPQAAAFRTWFADRSAARDWPALFDWRAQAPNGVQMHPTDEHLLPWFVAAGAGGRDAPAKRLHDSVTWRHLGMDMYGFGPHAGELPAA